MYILLFPYLLCMLPVHSIYAQNIAEIPVQDYLASLIITCIFITVGIFGLNSFINNIYISELIFCIIFFLLLYANIFFVKLFSTYKRTLIKYQFLFIGLFILICTAAAISILYLSKLISPVLCSKILFYTSCFINFFVLIDIIKKLRDFYCDANSLPEENVCSLKQLPKNLPDIYHIITDSHTGFDRSEYCDNYFKDELLKRGFQIYYKAKSNYNYTFCSVPSVLNMDYIENIAGSITSANTLKFYGKNKVFNLLKNAGYKIQAKTFNLYKHLLKNNVSIKLIPLKALSFSSIIYIIQCMLGFGYVSNNFTEISKSIYQFAKYKTAKPKYFFGHLMAPHYPYLYNGEGGRIPAKHSRNPQYYLPYLKYTNKQLLSLVDSLKQNMSPDSIIILHGDHSIGSNDENKFKILLAIYGDNKYLKNIPDNCTLVNLFRILFNNILNTDFPLLENKYTITNNCTTIWSHNHFSKRFEKLKQKYKNKRVLFYGTGSFFKEFTSRYNISELNIAGFSDIKYNSFKAPVYNKELGAFIVAPDCIYKLKPDIVFISLLQSHHAEQYFNEVLFKDKNNRFKYEILLEETPRGVIERLMAQLL